MSSVRAVRAWCALLRIPSDGTSGQIIAIQAPFGAFPYTPCQTHDSVSCLLTDHPEKIGVLIDQTIPTKVVEDPSGKAVDCVVITLAEYNKVCNPGSGEEH
ncbi:uncharacterized protein L969DRAFT_86944 [Mixia osmundae IAM 14324]|uniref:uncharacterized protein n=1 Tax=Mixia osmundae (strain CBS 9802 / IAM 14324 / JCM 22182 / KY 12970) TaxID=764103 RepID=UPI0004A557E1|nr:uncharacterized protein L969DRAFT_86944 [Mixia osmundae IAM 14324]KEI40310.1 hypothetical protein L969DRAFT_86944 [Mixia osmundae IAM 14324]